MRKSWLFFWGLLFLVNASEAFAAADFYGVKMLSEYYANDLTIDESQASPRFTVEKPGMDGRIYATATLSGRNLIIRVFNRSDETIQSDYDYAEYTVVTHDGERHALKPQPMAWTSSNTIAPNKNATFDPSFEGRALKKDEIRAIICSFDLGNMQIILLPLSKKFETKTAPPAPVKSIAPPKKIETEPVKPAAPKKAEEKKPSFLGGLFAPKKAAQTTPKPKPVEPKKETPKKVEEKKPVEAKKPVEKKAALKPAPPIQKPEPLKKLEPPSPATPQRPAAPAAVGEKKPKPVAKPKKIEIIKHVPASSEQGWVRPTTQTVGEEKTVLSADNEKKLLDQYEKSRKSRKYWRIEEIKDGVLVINLGAGDGLKPGASVQIARDGAFLAQATVRQLSQGYATAVVPQEAAANVKAGDDVLFFDATA